MRWRAFVLSLAMSSAFPGSAIAAPAIRPLDFGAPSAAERRDFAACVTRSGTACFGRIRAACMKRPDAETTTGTVACAENEKRLWDERVQALAASLRAAASPGQIAALDAASAQFEHWRAAKCAYAATLYEGGSLARIVAAECALETTADWSNALARRRAYEDQ